MSSQHEATDWQNIPGTDPSTLVKEFFDFRIDGGNYEKSIVANTADAKSRQSKVRYLDHVEMSGYCLA